MRAWSVTLELYHENTAGSRGILAETLEDAKIVAEEFYRATWRLAPGQPVLDQDDTAVIWDDRGAAVAEYSAYGEPGKIARWRDVEKR